jgi:hypothetical protein
METEVLGSSYLELMISASKPKLTPKKRGWLRILTPASCGCSPEMSTSIKKGATKIANNNYNNNTETFWASVKSFIQHKKMRQVTKVFLVLKGCNLWKKCKLQFHYHSPNHFKGMVSSSENLYHFVCT